MTSKSKLSFQKIIKFKKEGIKQKTMARICGVTPKTITEWKKQENSASQERKRKPKDYGDIPELLKYCISKDIATAQWEMANYVSKETGQSISQQTISRIIRKCGITYKKLTYHYIQLDEDKAKASRNYEEMESAIKKVVKLLNTKDLSEYFRHCVEYFDKKG